MHPLLLAMEKEQSAFDPTIYLKRGDPSMLDAE